MISKIKEINNVGPGSIAHSKSNLGKELGFSFEKLDLQKSSDIYGILASQKDSQSRSNCHTQFYNEINSAKIDSFAFTEDVD